MNSICRCQTTPRVPRPKNAFILYREAHYNAVASAQTPPVSSSIVSKILGKQWRNLPVDIKAEWKDLAQDEKRRHKQLYPDSQYSIKCPQCGCRRSKGSGSGVSASPAECSDSNEAKTPVITHEASNVCEPEDYELPREVAPAQLPTWTLCSILLPTISGCGLAELYCPSLKYQMVQVMGKMAISAEGVSFTLTEETIVTLAEYHRCICNELGLQESFMNAASAFSYSADHEVLDGLEVDGSGELKCDQSERAKNEIYNLLLL